MEPNAISYFAGNGAHIRPNRGDVDRDVGMVDWAWVKQRHHHVEVVVLAFELQRFAGLPCVPDGAHSVDVVTHPRCWRMPLQAIAALNVGTDLRAEPEHEATVRQLL